jgi:hexosaminidase
MVHLGYNEIMLEICGALEFKSHPEINKAWIEYCASVHEYPEKYRLVSRAYYRTKNSVHTCNAGGGVYTHDEMRELIKY